MRGDCLDILREAGERSFEVTLQTNGTLIDKKIAERLSQLPTLRVDISLYGAGEETHDSITGVKGSFQRSLKALRTLREKGVPLMIKTLVTSENVAEKEGILDLSRQLEIPVLFSPIVFPRNDQNREPLRFRLSDEQLAEFVEFELEHLASFYRDWKELDSSGIEELAKSFLVGPLDEDGTISRSCGAGITAFAINPYGDIYPCVAFPYVVGNIAEESFMQVWKNSKELEDLRSRDLEMSESCLGCRYLDSCAICKAISYLEEGNAYAHNQERCRQTTTWMERLSNERRRKG